MSKSKTRVPAKLSDSLQGNLTRYAAAAGAVGMFSLEAEVRTAKIRFPPTTYLRLRTKQQG
jgi:hypothetical protein